MARETLYLEIYRHFRRAILAGDYPHGTKLPSKRTVAETYGVSTVTAEHALALLCDEGYVESRERSGYFVIFSEEGGPLTPAAETAPPPSLPPVAPTHADFPFAAFAGTMRRTLAKYGPVITQRCEGKGCPALRHAISRYLARSRGIHTDPNRIVIGAGAEYLYGLLVQMLGEDRIYGIENPSFEKIELVYRAHNAICRLLPLAADGIDGAALAATDADVLHITPYRSFPSGVSATATKKHAYLRWVRGGERIIIEDDVESEFTATGKPADTLFSMDGGEHVIYLNSFSKTVFPAIRCAYMVLPPGTVSIFEEKVGFYASSVSAFEQYVLAEYIDSGDFERHINRVRRQKRRSEEK